jgi:hypothetical protein
MQIFSILLGRPWGLFDSFSTGEVCEVAIRVVDRVLLLSLEYIVFWSLLLLLCLCLYVPRHDSGRVSASAARPCCLLEHSTSTSMAGALLVYSCTRTRRSIDGQMHSSAEACCIEDHEYCRAVHSPAVMAANEEALAEEPPLAGHTISCRQQSRCALQRASHSPAPGLQGAQYAHLKFHALPWRPLGIPARGLAQDRGAATVEGVDGMLRCT